MKRSDFRIIQLDVYDGYKTRTTYRIERKGWFLWNWYGEVTSLGYAENQINSAIDSYEARKRRKVTKTIVG